MVELRDRKGNRLVLPLETNHIPYEDFGESYGVITLGGVPYLLVAEQAEIPTEGDIEGRKWKLVHPKSITFPSEFFEKENAVMLIEMIEPYVSSAKLNQIRSILEEDIKV